MHETVPALASLEWRLPELCFLLAVIPLCGNLFGNDLPSAEIGNHSSDLVTRIQALPERSTLRTGTGQPLVSLSLSLEIPAAPSSRLTFDFGFATAESPVPETFLDSFSISLQRKDLSATALLLTADSFGLDWAPPNPAGLLLNPDSIKREPIPFPSFGAELPQKFSFSVSVPLPFEFVGRSSTLFLDLFDNQNQLDSLAFLAELKITGTGTGARLFLQSSASGAGPYADEDEAVLDEAGQVFTVPRFERTRFYRIRSDSEVRIRKFEIMGDEQICHYEFPSPVVSLQSAAKVEGPYTDDPTAQIALANRSISVPQASSVRFYRVRSNLRLKIVRHQITGANVVFDFEYQPRVFALQSCPVVDGPYADESNVAVNSAQQTMSLSRFNLARFYRIRSSVERRISLLRLTGESVMISYGNALERVVLQSASTVEGPYQDEPSAQIDSAKRTIASARTDPARFYRIRAGTQTRIIDLKLSGNQVLLSYE